MTDLSLLTPNEKYIPFLTFILKLKLEKNGNIINVGYLDFDINFILKV